MRDARPRRVLLTIDAVGGVFTYALRLSSLLARRGVEVHLASMGPAPTDEQRARVRRLGGVALHESSFRLEWMDEPWDDVERAGDWLLDLERAIEPDVVHLDGYCHAALAWSAPVVVVAHSCVLSWWRAVFGEPAPDRYAEYRARVAKGIAAADAIVAPTRAMLDALAREHGPFARGYVVPNAGDPSAFRPAAKEPFVLSAGRLWDQAKNVAALARVAPRIDWPVKVAGSAEDPDGRRRAPDGLDLLGSLAPSALASWMARASIYALPARYEPFGLSAVEAALSGCALVLGDLASLREVWGDAATFVPPDDHGALERALRRLIDDARLRAALATRARARALELRPARMVNDHLGVYLDVLRLHCERAGSRERGTRASPIGAGPCV